MIHIEKLEKSYKEFPVLKEINLTIHKGDFVFLQGDSGSGKTTLLKVLYGEIRDFDGFVLLDNKNIKELPLHEVRRKMGVIFQSFELLEQKTALENVMLAGLVLGKNKKVLEAKARALLERVGLDGKESFFPNELSGGQQQRVAIARALLNEPKILIADEPTGNLDPKNSMNIMSLLKDINRNDGVTMLIVTHSEELVNHFDSTKIQMKDGGVVLDGSV